MFSKRSVVSLAKASLFKNQPIYSQFYITARCNLTCEQCNIIFANSDVAECSIDEIKMIADNYAELGVAMVLLTGGEPFARKDLPEIVRAFESNGVHVRMQTNGFASEKQIVDVVEAGGRDISISLDSLNPSIQDSINGGFSQSWHRALEAVALFTKHLPKEASFASFGCVLQPSNLADVEDVIRFGTAISWYSSVVPIHVTSQIAPRGFRVFDPDFGWSESEQKLAFALVERIRLMRQDGYLLYDSDQYLDDIKRFISNEPTTWRRKNGGVCDSPNLYFALLPNGQVAPCCDFRLSDAPFAFAENFPSAFRSKSLKTKIQDIAKGCDGCMYGSYPEISISMRYLQAKIDRFRGFIAAPIEKNWPWTYDDLLTLAQDIRANREEETDVQKIKIREL